MSCTPFHRFGPLKIVLVSARRELREGRLMVAKGVSEVHTHTHTHTHTQRHTTHMSNSKDTEGEERDWLKN